jgi:hypothetical protein
MLSPVHHSTHPRRRFGLTEVLLIAGIVVFGGLALVNDGRLSFGPAFAGVENVRGG